MAASLSAGVRQHASHVRRRVRQRRPAPALRRTRHGPALYMSVCGARALAMACALPSLPLGRTCHAATHATCAAPTSPPAPTVAAPAASKKCTTPSCALSPSMVGHAPALGAGLTLIDEQAMRQYVRSRHHDVDIRKPHANQPPSTASESDESETLTEDGRRTFNLNLKAPDGITPCTTRGDVWFDVTVTVPRTKATRALRPRRRGRRKLQLKT